MANDTTCNKAVTTEIYIDEVTAQLSKSVIINTNQTDNITEKIEITKSSIVNNSKSHAIDSVIDPHAVNSETDHLAVDSVNVIEGFSSEIPIVVDVYNDEDVVKEKSASNEIKKGTRSETKFQNDMKKSEQEKDRRLHTIALYAKHTSKVYNASVKNLRLLASDLLIANFYPEHMGKKTAHNIWKEEPDGWDPRIKFMNPNARGKQKANKNVINSGNEKRAKKIDLQHMIEYMIKKNVEDRKVSRF